MSEKIRTILADDHVIVLQGLRSLLEQEEDLQVVALVQNGDELLACLEKSEADVVVLDLEMPYHGLTALKEIRKQGFLVRVVVLTAFGNGSSIQSMLELWAEGFALKTESPVQLIESIRQVTQGQIIFPAAAQCWFMNQSRSDTGKTPNDLSAREWEVIECTARGMTNPEITKSLGVSANTVCFHLKSIFGKIQVSKMLQSITTEFNSSVEMLVKANCLSSADVPAGLLVYVPPKPSHPVPTQPKCGPPAGWITYIVRPGDMLYSIALHYWVMVLQLMFANCLNGTIIYSRQKLYVPNVLTIMPSTMLMVISTIMPSLTNTLEITTKVAMTKVTDMPVLPTDTLVPPTDMPVPPMDTSIPATTP